MADKPILFSAPMVRALLAGTKTQTRRMLNPQPIGVKSFANHGGTLWSIEPEAIDGDMIYTTPRINTGDRLWVRESWKATGIAAFNKPSDTRACGRFAYMADEDQLSRDELIPWRPSIHMPRWASRLTLTVTDVRVERLQDCSEADALAEGVPNNDDYAGSFANEYCSHCGGSGLHGALGEGYGVTEVDCVRCETPELRYGNLWDHINKKPGTRWADNPWVVAYSFRVIQQNIDQIAEAA